MKKKWKIPLFTTIAILLLAGLGAATLLKEKIPPNDISVTGNTAGNLNNHGLFAESGGKVYFSNALDGGSLYSMNPDETGYAKLNSTMTNSINVGGNYLYYYMDNASGGSGVGYAIRTYGVYRSKLDGSDSQCLDRTAAITMQLSGDYIYYQRYDNQNFTKFYKIKTDKSGQQQVSDLIINPASCYNGTIYFNGTETDHYLYALDTTTDTIYTVYQGNLWYPTYHNNYIYFLDVPADYRLCRYSLYDNTVEILTNDRVDTFNVGDYYIYYQKNSSTEPALMRMGLDGSNPETIMDGNFENINLTSTYAYFNAFGDETTVYHTPVNGPIDVGIFTPEVLKASK